MKRTLKWTVLAVAITAATAAIAEDNVENNWTTNTEINTQVDTNIATNLTKNKTYTSDVNKDVDLVYSDTVDKSYTSDVNKSVDLSYSDSFDRTTTATHDIDTSYTDDVAKTTTVDVTVTKEFNASANLALNAERNIVDTDIDHDETVLVDHDTTIDKEVREHGVSAELESDLSLTSDIDITGAPTLSGDLVIDSAAIAVIDNRQSNGGNVGENDELSNDASIANDVAASASGNLQFNVGSGDNNQQDNAAALSAADAGFAFGLVDSKAFVEQAGVGNQTTNLGVTNVAGIGHNAFNSATGNIGVNVTSGNNNQQKNSLAASVATAGYASAAVSSNQVSAGNMVSNAPKVEEDLREVQIALTGAVTGSLGGASGSYSGQSSGSYEGRGNAYQAANVYLDTWNGNTHTGGSQTGHIDIDGYIQGATDNPYKGSDEFGPIGGLAFDTDEEGTWSTSESGAITFEELGNAELTASLSGTLAVPTYETVKAATNTAALTGAAFQNASGNIGVNVSAGTGNQQANSLSLAVAQPGAGGPGG